MYTVTPKILTTCSKIGIMIDLGDPDASQLLTRNSNNPGENIKPLNTMIQINQILCMDGSFSVKGSNQQKWGEEPSP